MLKTRNVRRNVKLSTSLQTFKRVKITFALSAALPITGRYRSSYRLQHEPIIPQSATRTQDLEDHDDDAFLHLRHRDSLLISSAALYFSLARSPCLLRRESRRKKDGTEKKRDGVGREGDPVEAVSFITI